MNAFALSGLFIFLTSITLSVFFFWKGKNRAHDAWALFCLSSAMWGFGGLKIAMTSDATEADFWWRFTHVGVIFIPVFFVHFVYRFLEIKRKRFVLLAYFLGLVFVGFTVTSDLMIANMRWVFDQFYYDSPPGLIYPYFTVFFFGAVGYALFLLLKSYRHAVGLRRIQIQYFFVGMAISFAGGGTSFLPVYEIDVYPYLNFLGFVYPLIISYAIFKHSLLDVKLVLRRSSVFLGSLVTVIALAALIDYVLGVAIDGMSGALQNAIALAVAISFYTPIRDRIYRFANRYFFSSLYDSGEVIAGLSNKLLSVLDTERLYRTIDATITQTFHTQAVGILTFDKKNEEFEVKFNNGFKIDERKQFFADVILISLVLKRNKCVVVDDMRPLLYKRHKKAFDLLDKYNVEVIVPLNIKDELIGIVVLGPKESKDSYNKEDLQVLEVIRAQTSIALENALLYEETLQSERKLEQKVKLRTKDLQQKSDELTEANERLKQLDTAKTEFLSIASHQLRTPLSGIKGYVSMMNDGDFGTFKKGQHEILERVGTEVDRLVRLVQVFLDVSRIESGRLNITKAEFNFVNLVKGTVAELLPTAQAKNIKLTHKGRKKSITVSADKDKLKDVLVNLVDNAIKYTPTGSVWTEIEEEKDVVRFLVHDSGVGMEADEVARVFEKFARGKGIDKISTSGSGLGLFIAKRIVEEHNGTIWAESKGKGKGSVFMFEIPKK